MTEYTKEEWDGRELTMNGLLHVGEDLFLMGLYLLGALVGVIYVLPMLTTNAEVTLLGAVCVMLTYSWGIRFLRLISPRDWYEVTIRKEVG